MKRFLASFLLFGLCVLAPAVPVYAGTTDAYKGVADCASTGASDSAICKDNTTKDPISGQGGILIKIADIVAYVAGAAAIIIIIVSGIRFMTANGDSNAIASARGTIIGAIIGLAIIALAGTIIHYLVSRL